MTTRQKIRAKLKEIRSDGRFKMRPADVFINAPLALVQVDLKARVSALEWVLSEMTNERRERARKKQNGYLGW